MVGKEGAWLEFRGCKGLEVGERGRWHHVLRLVGKELMGGWRGCELLGGFLEGMVELVECIQSWGCRGVRVLCVNADLARERLM